jgi:hypothetical protein
MVRRYGRSRALLAFAATLATATLFFCLFFLPADVAARKADPFPNWMGEVDLHLDEQDALGSEEDSETGEDDDRPSDTPRGSSQKQTLPDPRDVAQPDLTITKRLLSWKPRLFSLDGVVGVDEGNYVKELANLNLDSFDVLQQGYNPSGVVTKWPINIYKDLVVYNIAKRLSTIAFISLDNFADAEIYRFGDAHSKLDLHNDLIKGIKKEKPGRSTEEREVKGPGQVVNRFFINLDEGQNFEIAFPYAVGLESSIKRTSSDCYGEVVASLNHTQTLMLHTTDTAGDTEDTKSQYRTCTRASQSSSSSSSFHSGNVSWVLVYTVYAYSTDDCMDDDTMQCPAWANKGECEANPVYMLEHCRRSCESCVPRNDAQQA